MISLLYLRASCEHPGTLAQVSTQPKSVFSLANLTQHIAQRIPLFRELKLTCAWMVPHSQSIKILPRLLPPSASEAASRPSQLAVGWQPDIYYCVQRSEASSPDQPAAFVRSLAECSENVVLVDVHMPRWPLLFATDSFRDLTDLRQSPTEAADAFFWDEFSLLAPDGLVSKVRCLLS